MRTSTLAAALILALSSCAQHGEPRQAAQPQENADAFVARINQEMLEKSKELSAAGFTYATYINPDTEYLNAKANERYLEYFGQAVEQSKAYDNAALSPSTARALMLLKLGVAAPAPKDPQKRAELSDITSRMEGMYGAAKYCPHGPQSCKDITALSDVLAHSRNYDELLDVWQGWHSTARPMRKDYVRFVELANEGARELGFDDLGVMWRSNYDMPAAEFPKETERLWGQVKPLYDSLHCYVRSRLQRTYGADRVPEHGAIPAHLLGNMWAQQWAEIYPLVEP
ncbi:MAG TPA: M2 family metallopeptidase, partial [Steroidobacteraceae bacterium]|nr:M2 family metallopeptidase [Steroidobacteraceae bacterium]